MTNREFDPAHQKAQIQGYRRVNRGAPLFLIALAFLTDLVFGLFLLLASSWVLNHPIWPDETMLILGISAGLVQIALGVWLFKKSIGLSTFGLEVEQVFPPKFQQVVLQNTVGFLTAAFLVGFSGFLIYQNLVKHPAMTEGFEWKPKPYVPPGFEQGQDLEHWNILPLYYTLGAWPKLFNNNPVFMYLPYAKGPPTRFPEKVVARWNMPNIYLTAEGPKTPRLDGHIINAELLRKCILAFTDKLGECMEVRHQVLGRHGEAFLKKNLKSWKLKWFQIDNAAIDASDIPRGIYFSGENSIYTQERYIILTASGKQQTFILDRTNDRLGQEASDLLEKSIRSLRVSYELQSGRALVNMRLSQTHVGNDKQIENNAFASQLAEIQSLLISKITVDPKDFQAYYHLGGTALMLAEHSAKLRKDTKRVLSEETILKLNEWSAVSKPTVKNVYLYAKDIKPNSPETKRLEHLWLEAQKY